MKKLKFKKALKKVKNERHSFLEILSMNPCKKYTKYFIGNKETDDFFDHALCMKCGKHIEIPEYDF